MIIEQRLRGCESRGLQAVLLPKGVEKWGGVVAGGEREVGIFILVGEVTTYYGNNI